MNAKPSAPAAARNSAAILGVLASELAPAQSLLEIGSGTGQHAVTFAGALPHIAWHTSDLAENHAAVRAWLADAGLPNVTGPEELDMRTASAESATYDAVYSSNTAHIMDFDAVRRMFGFVATALRDNGVFLLYGPFRQHGEFNTESNATFHGTLRAANPEMGLRDLESLDEMAKEGGMSRERLYTMPSNNHLVVWRRQMRDIPV